MEAGLRKREFWISKVLPGFIVIALWLDGWFYPLLALPLLYVLLVEKRSLAWLGFRRHEFRLSASLSALVSMALGAAYYPIFLYYLPLIRQRAVDVYSVFTDIFWYPVYEEIAYRGFALAHFAEPGGRSLSATNLAANLAQSLLFLSIHRHHLSSGMSLLLGPVFVLGLVNGFLFLKTKSIYGCVISHSGLNSIALLLHWALA